MITKKTIKSEEKTEYIIEIDEYQEICNSRKDAEERLEELKKQKEERLKDFLIAEKLFDYRKINFAGHNYLINPRIDANRCKRNDENGWIKGRFVSGIFSVSMSEEGWSPPEYNRQEQFLPLFARLTELGLDVIFFKIDDSICCNINTDPEEKAFIGQAVKEKDYWNNQYLMCLALKEAAYQLCLKID